MAEKRGYLSGDFHLFHNVSTGVRSFAPHYHDFCKVFLFVSGSVSYEIEGQMYDLQSGDVVLVGPGMLHRPIIHSDAPYERVILYISRAFLENPGAEGDPLFAVFEESARRRQHLLRLEGAPREALRRQTRLLAEAEADTGYAAGMLRRARFLELMVFLNRAALQEESLFASEDTSHPLVLQAISLIRDRIGDENLNADELAASCAVSRSRLMHLFREQTGMSIGRYITQKRLYLAREYLERGLSVSEACAKSGFGSYSAYYHARKKAGREASPGRLPAGPDSLE